MRLLFFSVLMIGVVDPAAAGDALAPLRQQMVQVVRADMRAIASELGEAQLDPRVANALAAVPRHEFVGHDVQAHAYENRPLPVGHGQTISQPTIVAAMTQLLALKPGERVLEIGTGSGYQAAILAELGVRVFTIEIIQPLGKTARERLQRLGYQRIETRIGDGYYGWPAAAPFDAIIVTAASNHVPQPLLEQLKTDGRMVIPVGNPFGAQQLVVAKKDATGRVTTRRVLPVRFVPLTGAGHDSP